MIVPLEMPGCRDYESVQFDHVQASATQIYPYTMGSQVYDWGGAAHRVQIKVSAKQLADAREWLAFYGALNGPVNTFWFTPPAMLVQTRSAGAVVMDGADQVGRSIEVRGLVANSYAAIESGRMISIHGRLHDVVENCVSDEQGKGTLKLWPGVATAGLPDGEPVRWRDPRGEFRVIGQRPGAAFPPAANHIAPVQFGAGAVLRRTPGEVDLRSEVDR